MIKVTKNVNDVPSSLIPGFDDLFPNGKIPTIAKNTHLKRMEIIAGGKYLDEPKYNNRYKADDVKIALNSIYNHKCAYCESRVEQLHVEHYRPKKVYFWLAFSWDNLIIACPTCNGSKGTNFDLNGAKATFVNNDANIRAINNQSAAYDVTELPKMVNPEMIDPSGHIDFHLDGNITSSDQRFGYTIEKCTIDRTYLNDERRKILDVFKRDVKSILVEKKEKADQETELMVIVRKFIRDAYDEETQFLGFRRFAISKAWLSDIVKEIA